MQRRSLRRMVKMMMIQQCSCRLKMSLSVIFTFLTLGLRRVIIFDGFGTILDI